MKFKKLYALSLVTIILASFIGCNAPINDFASDIFDKLKGSTSTTDNANNDSSNEDTIKNNDTSKDTNSETTNDKSKEKDNSTSTKNTQENDNVFLFEGSTPLVPGPIAFMKENGSDDYKPIFGSLHFLSYSDTLDAVIGLHENSTLVIHKDNKDITLSNNNAGLYESGAGHKNWTLGIPYKLSKDKSALVYPTKDLELVYVNSNAEQKIIGQNVGLEVESEFINERFFYISDDGNYVGFNTDYALKLYDVKNDKTTEIDRFVSTFKISPDGKKVIYTLQDQEGVFIKNTENNTQRKFTSSMYVHDIKIFDDGSAVFIDDVEEDMMAGYVTYISKDGTEHKLPSKIVCYEIFDDYKYIQKNNGDLYYIDIDGNLCRYTLTDKHLSIMANEVSDFALNDEGIYYVTNDRSIHKVLFSGESKIIEENSSDILETSYVSEEENNNVVSKSAQNKLYLNDKLIAEDVVNFVFYVDTIAYYTKNNNVYTYNINTKKTTLEFEDFINIKPSDDYEKGIFKLYYGDKVLYSKLNIL